MVNYRSWKERNKKVKKSEYVPLDERDDWDGKVEVLKPYKDHEWAGPQFESKNGRRK